MTRPPDRLTPPDEPPEQPAGEPARSRRQGDRATGQREAIRRCIEDFSRQLHDDAAMTANVIRAQRLFRRSGRDELSFCAILYQARAVALACNHIEKPAAGIFPGQRNRMPYFFAVLEDLLRTGPDTGGDS